MTVAALSANAEALNTHREHCPPTFSSSLTTTMSEYDSLHRQCRTLESLFDTKLTSYSRLASTVTRSHEDVEAEGSSERWKDLEAEVDELLLKVCP